MERFVGSLCFAASLFLLFLATACVQFPPAKTLYKLPDSHSVKPTRIFQQGDYSEGVVVDYENNLYFSHGRIITMVAPDDTHRTWAETGAPNGHKIRADGTHLVCDASHHAVLHLDADGNMLEPASRECDGKPLRGEKGELVCTASFPSMPIEFWKDPGDVKYRAAYFEVFPGVWTHGDFTELTEHRGMIVFGRSDAVLNPGGVRIGTAEIYRRAEQMDEVEEGLCIGQIWDNDTRVVLFVRLRN